MLELAVSAPLETGAQLLTNEVRANFPWLSLSILFPIVGSLLVPFIPDDGDGKQVRWFALGVALVTFLITEIGRASCRERV